MPLKRYSVLVLYTDIQPDVFGAIVSTRSEKVHTIYAPSKEQASKEIRYHYLRRGAVVHSLKVLNWIQLWLRRMF